MSRRLSEFLSADARGALHLELARLQEQKERLEAERDRHRVALDELENELHSLVEAMRTLSSLVGGLTAPPTDNVSQGAAVIERTSGSREGIAEAIDAVFAAHEASELHYKLLSELLQQRGVTLGGKDPAATLLSFITNAKYANRYERCGRGTYRLATQHNAETKATDDTAGRPGTVKETVPLRKSRRRRRVRRDK
jgi:hypothetical protein